MALGRGLIPEILLAIMIGGCWMIELEVTSFD